MGRHRSRSSSLSPCRGRSPPRRNRYGDPHERRTGLLVRNVALDSKPEDLRIPFERFGAVKDVYLPKNYYTGEPRGFAFVKFRYPEDAAEAKDKLNYRVIGGREIRIVYAEENRKTPQEMRKTARTSDRHRGSYRRRSCSRSPRRRYRSYSRSPSPARCHSRSFSGSESPRGRSRRSRETSPRDEKRYRTSRRSRSPRDVSPPEKKYRSSRRSPRSREESPLAEKGDYRSHRSRSPRKNYPDEMDHKLKGRSPSPRDRSPHDSENSRKHTPSSREHSPYNERKGKSKKRVSSLKQSSDSEQDYKSKHMSSSPVGNGRSIQDDRDYRPNHSQSPRDGRYMSRSLSRS